MGDLPDFITGVDTGIMQAASLVNGADAAKATYPSVGDVYLATDTNKLYICVAAGAWTGFDASILIQGILTLYADLAGGGFEIKNIKDPTAAQSAATAAYVLGLLTGYLDLAHETETTGIHGVGASTIDSVALRDTAIGAEATARAAADALRLLLTGGTMSGPIAMGTNPITGLPIPTGTGHATRKSYVDAGLALMLQLAGGTMTGPIAMGTSKITGLGDPTAAQDAATRAYVLAQKALCLLLAGGTMSGPIAMGGSKVTGLGAPTAAADAARKTDVDAIDVDLATVSFSQPSRALDTIYQNSTKIRLVMITATLSAGDNSGAEIRIGSGTPPTTRIGKLYHPSAQETERDAATFIVPPSWYYRLYQVEGNIVIYDWNEWDLH